jgi:predicted ArsR family transcriptional regulator
MPWPKPVVDQIYELLKGTRGMTARRIAEQLRVTQGTVERHLRHLQHDGRVTESTHAQEGISVFRVVSASERYENS